MNRIQPVVYVFDRPISDVEGVNLPFQHFETDWDGVELDFTAGFRILAGTDFVRFEARSDLESKIQIGENFGNFIEGLWESDVAEIFVREPNSTRYQEWNLSPAGDWWTCGLLDERERDSSFVAPNHVRTSAKTLNNQGWEAVLFFARPRFDLELSRINVTMILEDSSGIRRFLSCCPEAEKKPDFHNIRAYQNPKIETIS